MPKGDERMLKVSGVIGIPVSVPRFITLQDYRRCVLRLRDELHAAGFATFCLFFEQDELNRDEVIRRLKEHRADVVVWFAADAADRDTPLYLWDHGIDFIGVNLAEIAGVPCRYHVTRRDAVHAVLNRWASCGKVRSTIIFQTATQQRSDTERLSRLRVLIETDG